MAPVVQKVDKAIHRINHYPLDRAIDFTITYPLDIIIVIYPADSAIHCLNSWGLVPSVQRLDHFIWWLSHYPTVLIYEITVYI